MTYKSFLPFSDEIKSQITEQMRAALKREEKVYAVFDADGTLWESDMGEAFFKYEIEKQLLSLPKNPYSYYEKMKAENPVQAYLWLAQIHEGIALSTVREWAKDCVNSFDHVPVFSAMKSLIEDFKKWNVEIYIVTASIKWAVEPAAELVGLSYDNVIGIQTEIDNGLITAQQKGPITYKEGKAKAFFHQSQGISPSFAAGNTMGDYELLKSSKGIRLAIQSAGPNDENFSTEQELRKIAIENQWLHHNFC